MKKKKKQLIKLTQENVERKTEKENALIGDYDQNFFF